MAVIDFETVKIAKNAFGTRRIIRPGDLRCPVPGRPNEINEGLVCGWGDYPGCAVSLFLRQQEPDSGGGVAGGQAEAGIGGVTSAVAPGEGGDKGGIYLLEDGPDDSPALAVLPKLPVELTAIGFAEIEPALLAGPATWRCRRD